jgi:elongation factor G
MKELEQIRNIGIIAHIDAGKTSTTEGFLYYSGLSHRIGSIDDGTTVMDFMPEERERGITIAAAAATLPWHESLIHLIDTPGHIDFTAEVERSLRVIDGAVVIFSAVEGVEAQSEKVWHQADRYQVPKIAFVNKLDRIGGCFERVLGEINHKFGDCAVPIQEPVGVEGDFATIIDLLTMELIQFDGENHDEVNRLELPGALKEVARKRREAMLERLADFSDEIAMLYLEGEEVPLELLKKTLRELTISRQIVPVLLGSAKNRLGVQPLLDAVVEYLPSPADKKTVSARRVKDDSPVDLPVEASTPFAGMIFKVVAGTSTDLLYMRTYAGTLKPDMTLCNTRTGKKVKIRQILRLYAKNTQTLDVVGPGDIVGLVGLRDCGTGDTLCEMHHQVAFEKITFPEPVISMAIEPRFTKDKDKLDEVIGLLCREDPTLAASLDGDTGQRLLAGMGELHLEVNLNRLQNEFKMEAKVGTPRVAYRETFQSGTIQTATFEKMMGDTELFAEVKIAFRSMGRGGDAFQVKNSLRNLKQLPKAFVTVAERVLGEALRTGGARGYPLIYVEAELLELTILPDKTTEGAVAGAVLQAVNQAITSVGTKVLEPLMSLEIMTAEETIGEISNNLRPRRAVIHSMDSLGTMKRIICEVPLAEMFGFGKQLPKISGGRAAFSMEPCGYQELPEDVAQRLFGYL